MTRPTLLLLALLTLPTAQAADLDLTISSDGVSPVSLVLRDVKPGALPSVELPGEDGRSVRVDLLLADQVYEGAPAYDLTLTITRREPEGRRKVHEEVSRPTLRFRPNEAALVVAGGRAPVEGGDPGAYREVNFYRVEAMVRTAEGTL